MVSVFLVVLFIALLFGTRLLNRPDQASPGAPLRYSDRYYELVGRESLDEAELAQLELETCRFKRDRIKFLQSKPLANYKAEISSYAATCEKILPRE
jgi:hypothetical protein